MFSSLNVFSDPKSVYGFSNFILVMVYIPISKVLLNLSLAVDVSAILLFCILIILFVWSLILEEKDNHSTSSKTILLMIVGSILINLRV